MAKKDIFEDIVCDLDADIKVLQNKAEYVKVGNELVKRDEFGVMRDSKGRFVKGGANPIAARKAYKLDEILENKFGEDLEDVFEKIRQIAMYDPDKPVTVFDGKGNSQLKSRTWHFYNAAAQMQALMLMVKYYYGNPRKEIQIDQTVDIKIEKKVADLTKLINENQQRLKIVKGGKGE